MRTTLYWPTLTAVHLLNYCCSTGVPYRVVTTPQPDYTRADRGIGRLCASSFESVGDQKTGPFSTTYYNLVRIRYTADKLVKQIKLQLAKKNNRAPMMRCRDLYGHSGFHVTAVNNLAKAPVCFASCCAEPSTGFRWLKER